MEQKSSLVSLVKDLVLKKEGFDDLVYPEGMLLKVVMVQNDHVVVEADDGRNFILNHSDQGTQWEFL